jgi:hypothetical protein
VAGRSASCTVSIGIIGMNRRGFRHRWLVWLTLWVFGLATLAPTVSRALAAHEADQGLSHPHAVQMAWMDHCMPHEAAGQPTDLLDPSFVHRAEHDPMQPVSQGSHEGGLHLDHCALCVALVHLLAPPMPVAAFAAVTPPAMVQVSHPRLTFVSRQITPAHPRGPPTRQPSVAV